ncbi:LacI family DNA-binding transcriptional regulator [Bengtsoniella intestinalis]|uniref:LacI family DNA-binding transcriptional regulator n=1 Tax=Bengtsoniella intestinalis TaxID=3073143 RepID=UPI00391F2611
MATRKEVALEAGVSTAAVSYFINNNGYLSQEKREKIAAAIKKLNYRPNLLAKSLKTNDSKQLVFICNEIRNPFHAEVAYGASSEAYKMGYMTMFCNVVDDEDYILKMCSYMVSGVFISTTIIRTATINKIAQMNIPVVILADRQRQGLDPSVTQITIDYDKAMGALVDHVLEQGKRRIAYVASSGMQDSARYDGKTKALFAHCQEKGIALNPNWFVEHATHTQAAYDAVQAKIFTQSDLPDAFICTNDATALGVIRAITDNGLRVPEDVIVTGFDNTVYGQMSTPRLTTIDLGTLNISRETVGLLLEKCQGKDVNGGVIDPLFIPRESTQVPQ